ncbi:uncharacterized protein Dana_GF21048 [Drosophila ananassae]|uniref:Uncharacterized protein n=1 Tax=Drosophila ananassae TaxID=7217 RepID=B3MR74_DROAN|nr:uncharacterized protein LOC6503737 [Drosophila ananassae]EDV34279.1 uncharacterized protein Dana_GF21048 [Drosophila ananassae]
MQVIFEDEESPFEAGGQGAVAESGQQELVDQDAGIELDQIEEQGQAENAEPELQHMEDEPTVELEPQESNLVWQVDEYVFSDDDGTEIMVKVAVPMPPEPDELAEGAGDYFPSVAAQIEITQFGPYEDTFAEHADSPDAIIYVIDE